MIFLYGMFACKIWDKNAFIYIVRSLNFNKDFQNERKQQFIDMIDLIMPLNSILCTPGLDQLQNQGNLLQLLENTIITITYILKVMDYNCYYFAR